MGQIGPMGQSLPTHDLEQFGPVFILQMEKTKAQGGNGLPKATHT